jgi:predicted MPP superfamily phosphohydrolase
MSIVHRLITLSRQIGEWPAPVWLGVLAALAVVIAWAAPWALSFAPYAAVAALMLAALPWAGKSFGPPAPPALALAVVFALIHLAAGGFGWPAHLVSLGVLGAAVWSTWVAPFRLGLTTMTLSVPHLAADARALRILHIGDVHIERETARERSLNALISTLQPDLLLFSGDFVNLSYTHDPTAAAHIARVLGAWRARFGVLAVPGTPVVEPLPRVRAFADAIGAAGGTLELLVSRWKTLDTPIGRVDVLGLETTHGMATDRAALAAACQEGPHTDGPAAHESRPALRILLVHTPDLIPEAAEAGFDLYLCGHTHGGQIRLPLIGAVVTSSHYGRRFAMGRYTVARPDGGTMTAYVTRGVGLEGWGAPRARFLCPPEVVLWTVGGSGAGQA